MGLGRKVTIAPLACALVLALSLALAPLAPQARTSQPQTPEEIFLAAHAAVRTGDYDKIARYNEKLQGYLLQPYVESWLLRPRLEDAEPEEVLDFLAREQGSVLAEQVRRDWLKVLGKKRRWDLFRAQHRLLVNEDEEVACYALQDRWERNDTSAVYHWRRRLSPRAD
jgi:soluble lytic murein transglycosylase